MNCWWQSTSWFRDDFIRFKLIQGSIYFWHSLLTEWVATHTWKHVEMCKWRVHCHYFFSTTWTFCISITVNNKRSISARSCEVQYCPSISYNVTWTSALSIIRYFCKQRVWHHGPTGVTGNSSWIWCSFLNVTLKTFHVIPSFHWGCLTICHPGMWSDALQPSHPAATDFLLVPPLPIRLHLTPRGPCCGPELRPSQYLIRMGKEDLTLSALSAGPLPALLHASLLMSALLLHTFPNSPQF